MAPLPLEASFSEAGEGMYGILAPLISYSIRRVRKWRHKCARSRLCCVRERVDSNAGNLHRLNAPLSIEKAAAAAVKESMSSGRRELEVVDGSEGRGGVSSRPGSGCFATCRAKCNKFNPGTAASMETRDLDSFDSVCMSLGRRTSFSSFA